MMSHKAVPTRSWLFTPATRPDRLGKAAGSGADVVIADLEDSVAPDDKDQARIFALDHIAAKAPDGTPVAIRVNGLDTRAGISDLQAILASGVAPAYLIIPKTESAETIIIHDRLLAAAGYVTRLVALVESARGLAAVGQIATSSPRLAAIMFGAADMAADLGAAMAWAPLANARSQIVQACARAGIMPIDAPFFDIHDIGGLSSEIAASAAFGFKGKAAVHPNQVGAINASLAPTPAAIASARAVLAAAVKGVGMVDGRMIDEALARQARQTLASAEQTEGR